MDFISSLIYHENPNHIIRICNSIICIYICIICIYICIIVRIDFDENSQPDVC